MEFSSYLKNKSNGATYREKLNVGSIKEDGTKVTYDSLKQKSYRKRKHSFVRNDPDMKVTDEFALQLNNKNNEEKGLARLTSSSSSALPLTSSRSSNQDAKLPLSESSSEDEVEENIGKYGNKYVSSEDDSSSSGTDTDESTTKEATKQTRKQQCGRNNVATKKPGVSTKTIRPRRSFK